MSWLKRFFYSNKNQTVSFDVTAAQERRGLFLRYINRSWFVFGLVTLITLPLFPGQRSVFLFLIAVIFPTYLLIRFLNSRRRTTLAGVVFTFLVNFGFYGLFLLLVYQRGAYQAFETQSTVLMLMGLAVLFAGALIDKWAAPALAFMNTILLIGTRLSLAPAAEPRPSVIVLWWMLALIIWLYERILAQAFTRVWTELAERRHLEKAAENNRELAEQLYQLTPDALLTVDPNGRITRANAQALVVFGYPREELLNKPIEMLIPDRYHPKHQTDREKYFGNPRLRPMGKGLELFGVRQDGMEFPVEISLSPIHIGEETFVTAAIRDVTERKSVEQERESLFQDLTRKNAELERFIYTASHDLRSPIITIRGFLGYIEEDIRNANMERLQGDISRIHAATNKMRDLLDDLLDLSRVGRLISPPEHISFNEIVREVQMLMAERLNEKKIELRVDPNLPSIYGDRVRLVEVVQNLVDNAIKFMGNQTDPLIEIGASQQDEQWVFFVRDNGIGISSEYHERIFNLFDKLDPKSEGTGIGLAMVKRIIEFHNGKIWVEGEAGQGSTFYFTLPTK